MRALAIALALCCADAGIAEAQLKPDVPKPAVSADPTMTTAVFGSWTLRCVQLPATAEGKPAHPGGQACEVGHAILAQGQQQPIAQVALGPIASEKDLTLTVLVPVNISLPGQIRVSGNGKSGAEEKGAITLAWQRCVPGACVATAKLDAQTLAALRAGPEGQLRFIDSTGKIVALPLSWLGLDQALNVLEKTK